MLLPGFNRLLRMSPIAAACLLFNFASGQVVPQPEDFAAADATLGGLRTARPRILATPADIDAVRAAAVAAPQGSPLWTVYDRLQVISGALGSVPTVSYVPGSQLATARTALWRIQTLAVLGAVDDVPAWRARGKQELLAICAFPNWNPGHFLDTAEMMTAAAFGYDWLYVDMTASERTTVENAIVTKGLQQGLASYQSGEFWTSSTINWSAVCNGGLIVAALAVADSQPSLARDVLARARRSLMNYMGAVAEDGASVEGGYGDYALTYLVNAFASLDSASGTDLGLAPGQGLQLIGQWRLHLGGLSTRIFNYGNNGEFNVQQPGLLWLANTYDRPEMAICQKELLKSNGPHALNLLWWNPASDMGMLTSSPSSAQFPSVDLAILRRSWDVNALGAAIKGGNNLWNHNHLDLGTFVLDASGERWAIELGGDNAAIGAQRSVYESYYRVQTQGQNTMLFRGRNQFTDGTASLADFYNGAQAQFAILDLGQANVVGATAGWKRGLWLRDDLTAVVQDEWAANTGSVANWMVHTRAAVSVSGRRATLTQNGKRLFLYIRTPSTARFMRVPIRTQPGEASNAGITRISIRTGTRPGTNRVIVVAYPDVPGAPNPAGVPIWPLADWRLNIAGP